MLPITTKSQKTIKPNQSLKISALRQKKDVMPVNNPNKQIFIRFWLPVLLCMGFIFYTSSIPGEKIPGLFPLQDIAFHTFVYSVMACFFARALKNTYLNITQLKIIIFTIVFGFIYGISDELHQAFVPYRTVSGFDVFIDSLGSFAGSLIYRWPR